MCFEHKILLLGWKFVGLKLSNAKASNVKGLETVQIGHTKIDTFYFS